MMNLVSIDIETTGLDPDSDSIIQFGATALNEKGVEHYYSAKIKHSALIIPTVLPQVYLDKLFKLITSMRTSPQDFIDSSDLGDQFATFLKNAEIPPYYNVIGKNFGSFDWQFLRHTKNFPKPNYRFLDIGSIYFNPQNDKIPSLEDCLQIAKLPYAKENLHDALYDSQMVMALYRNFYGI